MVMRPSGLPPSVMSKKTRGRWGLVSVSEAIATVVEGEELLLRRIGVGEVRKKRLLGGSKDDESSVVLQRLRDVRLQMIPLASLGYDDCGVELAIWVLWPSFDEVVVVDRVRVYRCRL